MFCLSNSTTLSNSAAIQPFQTSLNECSPTYRYYSKKVVTQCKTLNRPGVSQVSLLRLHTVEPALEEMLFTLYAV